jgi:hypothetical protein
MYQSLPLMIRTTIQKLSTNQDVNSQDLLAVYQVVSKSDVELMKPVIRTWWVLKNPIGGKVFCGLPRTSERESSHVEFGSTYDVDGNEVDANSQIDFYPDGLLFPSVEGYHVC